MKIVIMLISVLLFLSGCSDADIASSNLSKAAEQFEIERRVVFYNGVTGDYMLIIEGRCSLGYAGQGDQLTVTCKVGDESYKKHFLGLSDNVTYFVEQLVPKRTNAYHYRVIFKPQTIIPDIDLEVSAGGR